MSSPEKTIQELKELYNLSELINKTSDLEDIYQHILSSIKKLLGVSKASILLFDPDEVLRFKASVGLSKKYKRGVEGHSPWKRNTLNPPPVLISNVEKDKSLGHLKKIILEEGIKALAFFPLIVKNSLIGKFMIYYKNPHQFTQEEIELAQTIGGHISFVINKRRASVDFLNAITDGIVISDKSGHLIFVNRPVALASGYKSEDEMLKNPGKWVKMFELKDEMGQPLALEDLPGRKVVKDSKPHQKLLKFKNLKTGEARWSVDKAGPIFDEQGEVKFVINILHDVTERMELEKRKDEFISTASHELKTPLAALKGFTQILEMRSTDDTSKYYLSKINGQINRITMLVDDLLDVSRIQSGKLKLKKQKFNIVELVEESAKDFQMVKDSHRITVKNGIPKKYVYGDKHRIDEVLNNLLSNAIKFSPKSNKVFVKIKKDSKEVIVSVKDFGIGIHRKNLQRVFEPFFQPSNTIRQSFSGLGLGLYISSQIVEQHKGRIWVKSEKGKGSTFNFSLPIN